jgi:hypothetical protein
VNTIAVNTNLEAFVISTPKMENLYAVTATRCHASDALGALVWLLVSITAVKTIEWAIAGSAVVKVLLVGVKHFYLLIN